MSYSPALTYFLDRLSGFSTNTFRLEPQNATSASANSIVRFTLPSNALINLRSFAFHFTATTSGTGAGARLPPKIDSLIERVEVSCGGVQLSSGANYYNVLCHAKQALMGDKCDPVLGHPEMVRTLSYVDGSTAITGTGNETYTGSSSHFCVDKWEGFLGSAEPKIMDSSLVPDIVVSIYLADNSVLASVAGIDFSGAGTSDFTDNGAKGGSYSLSNIHATVECMGLADGVYDNMVSGMIASKGFLEIPFKQYFSFQDSHSGQMRFSLATQSLDRIWMVHRDTNYNDQKGAVVIKGYKVDGGFTDIEIGKPQYDIGGNFDYNKEKYTTTAFNFPEPAGSSARTYQLQLNGAYVPQFKATFEEMSQISKNSVLASKQMVHGLDTMKTNYAVFCARLNLPESEFSRTISGLDTRGVSLNGYYNIANLTGTPTVNLFAECTSTLRIGAGRQLEVIQ
jgi:hypothetical protein